MTSSAKAHRTPLCEEALQRLLSAWQQQGSHWSVLALVAESEQERVPLLQAACRSAGVELYGAIFPALVTEQGFVSEGAWLLCLDASSRGVLLTQLQGDGAVVGETVADALLQELESSPGEEQPTLLMLFDGMLPNIASILNDLYLRLADRVDYIGVNAGSETFQPMPCLFTATERVGYGLLALILRGKASFALAHGFKTPEHMMVATSGTGNRIDSIDWQPAYDVYAEIIGREYQIQLTRDNFYRYAVHFPFGILRANGEMVLRIPVGLTEEGALYCVGEIPENAMLTLVKAPGVDENDAIDQLTQTLQVEQVPQQATPLLLFYCAGRRLHLGEAAVEELHALHRRSQAPGLVGALSLGEIGSAQGEVPLFHNAALVGSLWPHC